MRREGARSARRPAMIAARLEAAPPAEPFADDAAGSGYFCTDFHYEHLVARLRRHLAATRGFYLVSGTPTPDGEQVERALNSHREAPHRATLVRARAGMTLPQVTRAYARQLGLKDEGDGTGQWSLLSRLMEDSRKGLIRVLVLENADALDDRSFDELHRFATLDEPHFLPVVLLTERSFAARLDAPSLQFLQPAIVAHVSLQHLATEEVAAFIRYQLNATDGRHEAAFSRDAIAGIAEAAKGDPAVVNRLARQAAGLVARSRPAPSPPPAAAPASTPPPLAVPGPAPKQANAEQPKLELPNLGRARQAKADPPKAEPQITLRAVEAPTRASKPAVAREATASAMQPSVAAPAAAEGASKSAAAASPVTATLMRARTLTPTVTIAAYVLVAAVSAAAIFYALPPTAERDQVDAPQVKTVISSDLPAPTPRVLKPVAPAPVPAVPPIPEIAAAPPPAAPPAAAEQPVVAAAPPPAPPQPVAAAQPAPEPPPAAAVVPLPAPATQALAAIEPAAGAKPSEEVAKIEPAPAPLLPSATAKPSSQSVAKLEANPAPLPPSAADKPPSGAAAALVRRGEALLVSGDIASARQFFARAAETGDATAACGLGKSYDPLFLQRVGTRGIAGDPAKAVDWYRRAASAGSNEAAARLARLLVKFPQ